jgi:transaldolase
MKNLADFRIKIFADGANLSDMTTLYKSPMIKGFTTNPSLMRKEGIEDYEEFALKVLEIITDRPVSLEVFADDLNGMLEQAKEIGSWGSNVYVKIPVTNTIGEFTGPILKELSSSGVRLNITAVFTTEQVKKITDNLSKDTPAIISVFAGRIADTGLDPMPLMRNCLDIIKSLNRTELLWASPRELLNIIQADEIGCHIITATPEVIGKLKLLNKNLDQFSLETVQMFYHDAQASGYKIDTV